MTDLPTRIEAAASGGRELDAAVERVRKIGNGGAINLTYRQLPMPSLEVFRDDLLLITSALRAQKETEQ